MQDMEPDGTARQGIQPSTTPASGAVTRASAAIWLTLGIGLLYAGYFVLRYGGLWAENDTAVFSQTTAHMLQAGSVLFPQQYTHGFGYPAWLGSLSLLTGLPVPVLNTVVMPYVGMILVLTSAFLAYRALLGPGRASLLAVGLLFAVPDVQFSILRGNHEKLNIAFVLAAIYVLFKGFQAMGRGSAAGLTIWAVLFYAVVFANATANDYFASTFATAATLTLPLGYWLIARQKRLTARLPALPRFTIAVAVSWLLVWWFMFFVFPAAGQDFSLLPSTAAKIQSLFLNLQPATNPYTASSQQWASATASWTFSTWRWLLIGGSFAVWILHLWRILVRRGPLSLERLFLLALYGAFGFLVALAIPVDFVGLVAGSNLELRNFTYFALLAVPLLTWGMRDAFRLGLRRRNPVRRPSHAAGRQRLMQTAGVAFVVLIVLGLLKTSVDPLISNQWIFYSPAERQALNFFQMQGRGDVMWTGPDNRLVDVVRNWAAPDPYGNEIRGYMLVQQDRDWLRSPQVIANAVARRLAIPPYEQQNRVYDNGAAQIYRVAPQTPFQN